MTTPLSVYLPFNRDCLRGTFVPAKRSAALPAPRGHWLIVQEQNVIVVSEDGAFRLPTGELPADLAARRVRRALQRRFLALAWAGR